MNSLEERFYMAPNNMDINGVFGRVLPDYYMNTSYLWKEVGDVMISDIATIESPDVVVSAAKIMSQRNISCILVQDNDELVGILTETDILKKVVAIEGDIEKIKVVDIMSSPVESVPHNMSILDASIILQEKKIKRLPVLKNEVLAGIVTQTDLIRSLTSYGLWKDVEEIMNEKVAKIRSDATLSETAKIMSEKNISSIVVMNGDDVIGVLTERDIFKKIVALKKDPSKIQVAEVMSTSVISVPTSCSIFSASRMMERMHIRRLVVMENNRLCGIITQTDLIKAVNKKLREKEKEYLGFLESSEYGIYTIDQNENTTYVNQAFIKLLGVSDPSEFINNPFLPEKYWPNSEMRTNLMDELKKLGFVSKEVPLINSQGKKIWISFFSTFTKNIHGEIAGSQGIIRDITAEKELITLIETKEKLRESEERFRELANLLPQTVFEIDLEGNINYTNQFGLNSFGYSSKILEDGLNALELFIPEDMDRVLDNIQMIINGEDIDNHEYTAKRKDGSTFPILIYSNPIIKNNKPVGLRGIVVDITERKQAEERIKKLNEELENRVRTRTSELNLAYQQLKEMQDQIVHVEKMESIGTLAGGIAHDFNNILTAIMGNISLAKMSLNPEDKIYHLLTESERASQRAKDLTEQLLTFSKGGMPLKKVTNITDLIKDSATFVSRGSNVMCKFSFGKDIYPVEIDEGQISQVIYNLIINADQAMPDGGIIKVKAENVIIGVNDRKDILPLNIGEYVRITIEDKGIGIPKDHLQKIFEPYFTTKEKGSGLGLATAYSIIKNHDGHISVNSELGTGTYFSMYLPASNKTLLTQDNIENVDQIGNLSGKVLVMDDEEIIRELVGEILNRFGYETVFASDGAQAIEIYKDAKTTEEPFDAVIIDLTIPGGMGGKEAIQKLVEYDPKIKAIVSSGYSNDPIMANFREFGFSGVIAKPYRIEELGRTVHNVIQGEEK